MSSGGWLVVLAEAEAIRWVFEKRRMAFSEGLCSRANRIQPGEPIVLYMARGAYHNPTRDKSQVIGLAHSAGPVRPLARPVALAGRSFVCGMQLDIELKVPEREGVLMESLVNHLQFIKRPEVWGQYLRGGLIRLSPQDLELFRRALEASP